MNNQRDLLMKKVKDAEDIFTELPDNLKENILDRVPLKDAVRTSALSHKWRYIWVFRMRLHFDDAFVSLINQCSGEKYARIVGEVDSRLYLKETDMLAVQSRESWSWILKALWKLKATAMHSLVWNLADSTDIFPAAAFYKELKGHLPDVPWRKLFFSNYARPRATFCLWMCCHGKLLTKDRLLRFGIPNDGLCCFCGKQETIEHLFFDCAYSRDIWNEVLAWLKVHHVPQAWNEELLWLQQVTSKRPQSKLFKIAVSECVYMIWRLRNKKIFAAEPPRNNAGKEICHIIAARCVGHCVLNHLVTKLDGRA